jgi:hypothetical protein
MHLKLPMVVGVIFYQLHFFNSRPWFFPTVPGGRDGAAGKTPAEN